RSLSRARTDVRRQRRRHHAVHLRSIRKFSRRDYRLTLDVVDPDREHWDDGDCQLQIDLSDEPSHRAQPRGPLGAAFETYRLSPTEPPTGAEAKLLWDMGHAVHHYVDRIFQAGIICPFQPSEKQDTPDRSE